MKYGIYILSILLFISCSSDDDMGSGVDYSEENEQEILEYISVNNIDATRTNSGLYYFIEEQGTGEEITETSDISIIYTAYTTDGTELFSSLDNIESYRLASLIQGIVEGAQYFNEGGKGQLIIPAHLAYGNQNGPVEPGTVLVFHIEFVDLKVHNEEQIVTYLAENNIENAIRMDSGLYYSKETEGTSDTPDENSNVTVVYKGYFLDGEIFDVSNDNGVSFNLNEVIPGWTEGIQQFKVGGIGALYIPSHLGYGRFDYAGIPGGSVLIFDVELKSIN